jgi:uncharacterized membrane protein YdjX (TVP38/TMEM64 family)
VRRGVARAVALAALAGAVAAAVAFRDRLDAAALEAWLAGAGAAAPLLFVAAYALAAVLFLPGSVLTIAGGALFGPVWGTLYNLAGATLGAALAFLIARHLGADWVQARLARGAGGRLERLVRGVEAEGWRFVAFTRLVPLFPYNALNYALGLTRIPLLQYALATFVFMAPGALAYTWLGHAGREALAGEEGLLRNALIALALLAAVAFLPRLVARLRQAPMLEVDELAERLRSGTGIVLDVRSPQELAGEQGHIPGVLNIPLDQLPARLGELGDDPERPIAIVCRTDRRSARAAALLARHGFRDARVVRGGMTAWHARGLPVERGKP